MLPENGQAYFRSLLNQQLGEVLREARTASGDTTDSTGIAPDVIDQAYTETHNVLSFHMKERDSRLVRKIKDALAKLENGAFGICEECGGRISEGRLKARPIARLCIRCKEKEEHEEKLRGL
jgi:DnaK suppressor protein